mgnify:CR=1 FL=1
MLSDLFFYRKDVCGACDKVFVGDVGKLPGELAFFDARFVIALEFTDDIKSALLD